MTSEGWTYQLTDEDARLASALAARRDEGKPDTAHAGSVSKSESRQKHVQGLKGEIAVGRTFGWDIDLQQRKNGDEGYDFQTPQGLRVEVKYRAEPNRDFALKGNTLHPFVADVGVLTWEEAPRTVRLVGWTTPAALAAQGQTETWPGCGEKLYVKHEDLFAMEDFARTFGL
ncbi:hypothetical protein [Salinibacter ruber]|uniref:hypothetical protein n=1 Tax=Salinibacter ruber TaxID=146919 RepID=UPI00216AA072|nr:hypothetical protein [Salinibacter ruber]MCS3610994.1 hypothetical protein [Salinibacter ruber]